MNGDPDPGIDATIRDLQQRVQARRDAGQYPATLDADLEHHYQQITVRREPTSPLREALLEAYDTSMAAIKNPQIRDLAAVTRAALVRLCDELPESAGLIPERVDDLFDRTMALERVLGAGPESISMMLERLRRLEDDVAALQGRIGSTSP